MNMKLWMILLMINSMLLGNQALCNSESQKAIPQSAVLLKECLSVAQGYEASKEYESASWYYLLAGRNKHNIEKILPYIRQEGNLANVAHSFVLEGNMNEAKRLYKYFIYSSDDAFSQKAVKEDYQLLYKLYPQKEQLLNQGFELWQRVFSKAQKNSILITKNNEHLRQAVQLHHYQEIVQYVNLLLPLYIESFGETHLSVAMLYANKGSAYNDLANYTESLRFAKKALILRQKILNPYAPELADSYNNVAVSYQILGNDKKALKYFFESLKINKKSRGEEHIYTAQVYSGIGRSYEVLKLLDKSLNYQHKALNIYLKNRDDALISIVYNNLGSLYLTKRDYGKAIEYFEKSLSIRENLSQKDELSMIQSYGNLGTAYTQMGQQKKALPFLLKALNLSRNLTDSLALAQNNQDVGWCYFAMADYDKAYFHAKQAFDIFLKNRDKYFMLLDASDKESFLKNTNKYIFLLVESTHLSKKHFAETLNDWLAYKGSLFESQNSISSLYYMTDDSNLKKKIELLNSKRTTLAKLYQSKENKLIKGLEEEILTLNNELQAYLPMKDKIDYHAIANSLKENELYIDYARIAENYFVFTIDSQANISIEFIHVKKTEELTRSVLAFRRTIKHGKEPSSSNLNRLYTILLKDILEKNSNKNALIISPDGILNLFPFETLYLSSKSKFLIEEKNIHYVPSGKEFVRLHKNQKEQARNSNVVLFSNPNFNKSGVQRGKRDRLIAYSLLKMVFSELPGTKAEATAIENIVGMKHIKAFTGEEATEENLLKVYQPKILHIATHGFFIKSKLPNPMLKSGIALAGANQVLAEGSSSGVVTALKLSSLNLKGTELVVLSACETGLVDIDSTDSISGLSKAFIQAGAKDIVVSLWSVSDMGTKNLMTLFYRAMQNNKSYVTSLRKAKLEMIKKGVPVYIWSPFIINGI